MVSVCAPGRWMSTERVGDVVGAFVCVRVCAWACWQREGEGERYSKVPWEADAGGATGTSPCHESAMPRSCRLSLSPSPSLSFSLCLSLLFFFTGANARTFHLSGVLWRVCRGAVGLRVGEVARSGAVSEGKGLRSFALLEILLFSYSFVPTPVTPVPKSKPVPVPKRSPCSCPRSPWSICRSTSVLPSCARNSMCMWNARSLLSHHVRCSAQCYTVRLDCRVDGGGPLAGPSGVGARPEDGVVVVGSLRVEG